MPMPKCGKNYSTTSYKTYTSLIAIQYFPTYQPVLHQIERIYILSWQKKTTDLKCCSFPNKGRLYLVYDIFKKANNSIESG
jgi:hypothetical protein